MLRAIAIAVVVASLTACTHSTSASAPVPTKGKPTAPVAVSAELSEKSARVTVKFEADAKEVDVSVSGVDGLVVEGELAPAKAKEFARGDSMTFDVAMTRPAGRAQLVVTVSGSFGGGKRARVASFTVGDGPLPASPGEVMTTDDGDTVKVLPAGTK